MELTNRYPMLMSILLPILMMMSYAEPTSTDSLSYLALGDSYTIGESVAESDRWPVQLTQTLSDQGTAVAPPRIIARTGWTTDELQAAIAAENITQTYDLVSLLIGVNNQYRGYPIDQFTKEFEELLDQAIVFAGGQIDRVFVVSIPDYGVTPFAQSKNPAKIATEIDQYNQLSAEIAERKGVAYYDITPISRVAAEDASLIATDGLHPSGQMYSQWVELIAAQIAAKLNK